MAESSLLRGLAGALASGERTVDDVAERCAHMLGRRWRWLRPLARRYLAATEGGPRPRRRRVVEFLRADRGWRRAYAQYHEELALANRLAPSARMQPAVAAAGWNLPALTSAGELAEWLGLTPGELDWLADLKALGCRKCNGRLRHYSYRVLEKPDGAVRLIEAPKSRLKRVQRRILEDILESVPAHAAVHGFVKGRSTKTFAAPHVGQAVILRLDIRDFFPSIGGARVQTVFRTLGYPEPVADLLGGMATNAAPRDVLRDPLYQRPHLPQGAPTSPALANICFYRADCRMQGLAESAGARYTRYADDLAFSGGEDFARGVHRFAAHAAAILHEEGFAVNHRKTRIMRRGVRQHLAGIVANRHLNIARDDFDRLKAVLNNCARHGPEGQNREGRADFRAHLAGRVSYAAMIHPAKGARLQALFERIAWQGD